jgi:hypothetical protein
MILTMFAVQAAAQAPWVGNTLITPLRSTETFLIDIDGNTIQTWHGDNGAGHTVYLLPDLSVLRGQGDPNGSFGGGGAGGHLQRVAANGSTLWEYFFSNADHQQHHDIAPMPNGNVLIIAWEIVTPDEAIAAGRTAPINGDLWPTLIVELEPVGSSDANIIWEWRIWDHIIQDTDAAKPKYGVIADHPERIDVNLGNTQRSWDHANFIDYDPILDQIVYSSRRMNEVFVIDHSTTTAEAAGHTGGRWGKGGDLLYRWGNPQNYGRGTANDQVFWGVHGANFIDNTLPGEGGILAFNNGNRDGDANDRSSVVAVQPPRDANGNYVIVAGQPYGPAVADWIYEAGNTFYSLRYGSAFRMPNNNTLICEGAEGFIFEVNPDGTRVWTYIEPIGNGVFAAQRYWDESLATAMSFFDARINGLVVEVTAEFASDQQAFTVNVYRGRGTALPTELVHSEQLRGNRLSFRDDSVVPGRSYSYRLSVRDSDGEFFSPTELVVVPEGSFALEQNVPNPFNPTTTIRFSLPESDIVSLAIYDGAGHLVRTLVDGPRNSGLQGVDWDGMNNEGQAVTSGVYFYRLRAGRVSETKKMVLLR